MRAEIVTIGQIPHDVKEPVAHPAGEVGHLIRRALRHLFAGAKVFDVSVIVLGINASFRSRFAEAPHPVQLAIRVPRLVLVTADLNKVFKYLKS